MSHNSAVRVCKQTICYIVVRPLSKLHLTVDNFQHCVPLWLTVFSPFTLDVICFCRNGQGVQQIMKQCVQQIMTFS